MFQVLLPCRVLYKDIKITYVFHINEAWPGYYMDYHRFEDKKFWA